MTQDTLRLALRVPSHLVSGVEAYLQAQGNGNSIASARPVGEDELAFDPATAGAVWLVLSFMGGAVLNVALGVIGNAVYDHIKAEADAERNTAVLRLPTGEQVTISATTPLRARELEQKLRESLNL